MRILVVHNFYQQPGGENAVAQQEIERLQASDNVRVYRRHNDEIKAFGIADKLSFFWNTIHSRTTSADIRKLVGEFHPDFAFVHNVYPLISPSLYHTLQACGVPILQVVHDFRPFCANGWFYTNGRICNACKDGNHLHAVRNKCYRNSYALSALYAAATAYCRRSGALDKVDAFLCLTQFTRDLLGELGVPPHKLFVRPNCIDASHIRPSQTVGDYVAYIGRLSPEKGLWTLVRGFEKLGGTRLKIAGTGPLERELRTYVRDRCLAHIELVGFMAGEDKWKFLSESRLVVIPSECYEMFPLALLEAYASGKPVVASNLGGLSSLVENGVTGFTFKPGDPSDLANRIDSLWNNQESVARMGACAQKLVEERFSPAAVYRRLINIAQQVRARGRLTAAGD